MSNPYIPNSASIPNILFDYWMSKLSHAEFKVLMAIARKTYGWNKTRDRISLRQLEELTGIHKTNIVKATERLCEIGLVLKYKFNDEYGALPNQYEINVDMQEISEEGGVVNHGGGSSVTLQGVVAQHYRGGSSVTLHTKPTINKTHYTKEIPPLISPQKSEEKKARKPKAKKAEFSPKVHEVASRMLEILKQQEITYRPPADMSKFLRDVEKMVEDEGQDVEVLLKAFEWAVSDTVERGTFKGWKGVICRNIAKGKNTNPVEIFHKNLSTINSQRKARPVRKFGASSNHDAALECMEEMNKTAL